MLRKTVLQNSSFCIQYCQNCIIQFAEICIQFEEYVTWEKRTIISIQINCLEKSINVDDTFLSSDMDNPYHYYFVYRKLYNTVSGKLYCVYSLSNFVQSSQVYKFSYSYKTVSLQIIYSRMTSACYARLVLLQHHAIYSTTVSCTNF